MLEIYQQLIDSAEFREWQENNPDCYLTHFYCQLNSNLERTSPWEIGFYNTKTDKITVFLLSDPIGIKSEEEVFKKEGEVEELKLEEVKTNLPEAVEIFKKIKIEKYLKEELLSSFLILQKFENKTIWNISAATRSMQILNVKIDARNKEVVSDQLVSFIQQNK
ncbi:MAG: hypothetical protein ABIA37_04785 [Candidatus Woesearchaeota archaeon]